MKLKRRETREKNEERKRKHMNRAGGQNGREKGDGKKGGENGRKGRGKRIEKWKRRREGRSQGVRTKHANQRSGRWTE